MAAALFAEQAARLAGRSSVASAGLGDAGLPVPDEVLEVMHLRGIDLTAHRSTTLTPPMVGGADLVVGMGLRHVQEAVLMEPVAWERTFRLKEIVRRGEFVGPRLPGQDVAAWVRAAQGDRDRTALAHLSPEEDVADPYGGPFAGYEATAVELEDLTGRLATLLWPADTERQPPTGGHGCRGKGHRPVRPGMGTWSGEAHTVHPLCAYRRAGSPTLPPAGARWLMARSTGRSSSGASDPCSGPSGSSWGSCLPGSACGWSRSCSGRRRAPCTGW